MYRFKTAEEAFEILFGLIVHNGEEKDGTKFIRNVMIEIHNPFQNLITTPWRKWSHDYAELEWNWYMTGERNPAMVEERAKLWKTMKDDTGRVWSNYGWWWALPDLEGRSQLDSMIDELKRHETTRRAVLSHYAPPNYRDQYKQDTPCNLILNFYLWEGKVNLTVFARSIDLVFGFCNDQYCFSKLMLYVRDSLPEGYHIGTMTYMITDLHVYKKDWNRKNN